MFKMIEVAGTSPLGFSEAINDAVSKLTYAGEKIHFFEVLQYRGAVKDGKISEFQVVVKFGAETKAIPSQEKDE